MPQQDENNIKGLSDLLAESKKSRKKETPEKATAEKTDTPKMNIRSEETEEALSEKLTELEVKQIEKETEEAAQKAGLPYINLVGFPVSDQALTSIDKKTAQKHKVVCFYVDDNEARLGVVNPNDPELEKILEHVVEENTYGGNGAFYLISEHSFNHTFKLYEKFPERRKEVSGVEISGDRLTELQDEVKNFGLLNARLNEETNMTGLIELLLAGALKSGASDIHLEAEEENITIRYRIDGVLHIVGKLPKKVWKRLNSRVKTIAGLKINVTNVPQDGRITLIAGDFGKVEIRVSTLPTSFGESIVMRILSEKNASFEFDQLGLRGRSYNTLKEQVERPTGLIVTTGPTGSGKTTTLYAMLNKLNDQETKIITLEDPIEYRLPGISQSQIDHSKGYTFAEGLRSILRQDPDVIMVGELRDIETVETAVQAALTGHKVLSTIHTNDAAGAIPRFLSMGAKPYLLAPSLNAVIGQRLVRKICENCKIEKELEPAVLEKVKAILADLPEPEKKEVDLNNLKFYRGGGCEECNHLGYKGRIGIYEIFTMTEKINEEILNASTDEYKILRLAKEGGMITMAQDGLLKALDKITSVEEIFRVSEVNILEKQPSPPASEPLTNKTDS